MTLSEAPASPARVESASTPAAGRILDAIRGVAALLVVVGHSRGYLADAAGLDPKGSSTVQQLLLAPAGVSMEAVAVFFVLSGYLVGGQVIRQCRADRFDWRTFLVKRLSRLWTVLLPGLVVTALVVAAGRAAISPALRTLWGADDGSALQGACNAVFLQKSRCGTFSVNEALWSLSYEFWFYIVFAAATAAWFAVRRRRSGAAAANAIVLIGAIALFGPHLLLLMPAWLFGAGMAVLPAAHRADLRTRTTWTSLCAAVAALGAAMLCSTLLGLSRPVLMVLVGLPATLVVLTATRIRAVPRRVAPLVTAGAAVGRVSFSIYVFHLPFVVMGAVAAARLGLTSVFGLPAATYALAALVLPVTWLLWSVTERYTPQVRALSMARINPAPARTGRT